jgi:hypothetical protein
MVKTWFVGLVAAGALLLGAWWLLGGDRELKKITRQSDRLATALHKAPGDGLLGLATRTREIADFFARQARVTPGEPLPVISSREELLTIAGTTLQAAGSLEVKILDREVHWIRPQQEAAMRIAVEVLVQAHGERQKLLHTYDVAWIREDGRWVIASAQVGESIRRPAVSGQ